MRKRININVKQQYVDAYKKKYPLIRKDRMEKVTGNEQEGDLIRLIDSRGEFIALGYYGKQNKGLGWVLSWKEKEKINKDFFKRKLSTAFDQRASYFQDENTTAFRLFNGEGDGIGGLTIDYFAGYILLQFYSKGIYSFREEILQALEENMDYKAIYEKKRFDTKGQYVEDDDFVKGTPGTFPIIIKENGINYAVNLNDGAMVGIFLDQRNVRKAIRDRYAKGRKVLNTFSYTGAFSVAAMLGEADITTSVDLAKRSKPLTIEQFSVNGIDFEAQQIVVMDVFDYFRYAKRKELMFDLVILDPPSFARSKKRTFKTEKDYSWLIEETIAITEKNGIIIASANTASFGMNKFKKLIDAGFHNMKCKYRIMESFSLPSDFKVNQNYKESDYLKVLFIEKLS